MSGVNSIVRFCNVESVTLSYGKTANRSRNDMSTLQELSQQPLRQQSTPSFGEYTIPEGGSFAEWISAHKTHALGLAILCGICTLIGASAMVCIYCISSIALGFPLLVAATFVLAAGIIISLIFCVIKTLRYLTYQKVAPPSQELQLKIPCTPPGVFEDAHSVSTWKGPLSNQKKLELIRSAQHSIVLCGCYCGGEIFQKALDAIEEKLQSGIKEVYVISSSFYLKALDEPRIKELALRFPDRFFYKIFHELTPSLSPPSLSWSFRNFHVKALIVDYGRAVMMGGGGLADAWSQKIENPPAMLSKFFHDIDHLVFSENSRGVGVTMYAELLKLFAVHSYPDNPAIYDKWKGVTGEGWRAQIAEGFSQTALLPQPARCKVLISGPEHPENAYLEEFISLVKNAQKSIYIAQMYFHPDSRLLEALKEAARRNVQIRVLTNGQGFNSPSTHCIFASLNQTHCRNLLAEASHNVEIYEWRRPGETIHMKLVVVDGTMTLNGSHNISYKSLEGLIDDELSLAIDSAEVAQEGIKVFNEYATQAARMHLHDYPAPFWLWAKSEWQKWLQPVL